MTSIAFVALFGLFLLGAAGFLPFGILAWLWFSLQVPQQLVGVELPFNLAIVVACLIGVITQRKRTTIWFNGTLALLGLMVLHTGVTTLLGYSPEYSYPYFDRLWKTAALAIFIAWFMQDRTRLHAVAWTIALSLGALALKGTVFSIVTLGQYRVMGPAESQIGDNNHFAGALCMTIPFIVYLSSTSKNYAARTALTVSAWVIPLAVLFTYSRGGLVALSAVAACYWLQTRHKLIIAMSVVGALVLAIPMMPSQWLNRMQTISETVEDSNKADDSVKGRFDAWYVYYQIAIDRPLIGGGFRSPQLPEVWLPHTDNPNAPCCRAAHNNVFQVIGEHGFLGLIIYLLVVLASFNSVAVIILKTRHVPELAWARGLATACGISLLAYMIAGLTISIPYYDLFIVLVAVVTTLRKLVRDELKVRARQRMQLPDSRVLAGEPVPSFSRLA